MPLFVQHANRLDERGNSALPARDVTDDDIEFDVLGGRHRGGIAIDSGDLRSVQLKDAGHRFSVVAVAFDEEYTHAAKVHSGPPSPDPRRITTARR